MRASVLLIAFSALAAAQLSSESVDSSVDATTTTDAAIGSSTDIASGSLTDTSGLGTPTETASSTASQPLIPTGSPGQSTPAIGSSSGISTTASPTTTSSSDSSTSSEDSSTSTETEASSTTTTPGSDAEETNSDNGAFALPTAGPLLGAGLAGAALAAFI